MPRTGYIYTKRDLSHRMTLPVTREMRDFLDRFSRLLQDSGGKSMGRTQIVRALIHALMRLEGQVDSSGITDERILQERLVKAFSNKRR